MKIAVLTGAGISAESGLQTFRDADGMWHNYKIEEVASIDGWRKDKKTVLEFYNQRRKQLKGVQPNKAHIALKELAEFHNVQIITQNVDDLHERAGNKDIIHLHGELLKVRSSKFEHLVYYWENDLVMGDFCEKGHQLRPHIVWFGEAVPLLDKAATIVSQADAVIIVGTSLQVYPAASLIFHARQNAEIYYIDLEAENVISKVGLKNIRIISEKATIGVPLLVEELKKRRY